MNVLVGSNRVVDWADLQFTSAPVPLAGDFNRDNHVNTADVAAMVAALTNLSAYVADNGLSNFDLLAIADLNHNGVVNNADVQSMLVYVAAGGGSASSVPEPGSFASYLVGSCAILWFYWPSVRAKSFIGPCSTLGSSCPNRRWLDGKSA